MTYRSMGDIVNAGKWLRPVLAWAERLNNHSVIGQACEDLGEIEIVLGHREQGTKLLDRARDEYEKAGFNETWPEVWENINQRLAQLNR